MKALHEAAHIIHRFENSYQQKHQPTHYISKTLRAVKECRTANLGGHIDLCDNCNHKRISYNSCRNRHCPKCQVTNRERWLDHHEQRLLPVKHFHCVFTLPHELNGLCIRYPKLMYGLLFDTVWQTISGFAANADYLAATTGMTAILHTWGQQLMLHPHVHCIIPAGGITADGVWKNSKGNGTFLFPVKPLKKVFRAKYVAGLRKLIQQNFIAVQPPNLFDELFKKDWVVHTKRPFSNTKSVMEYLGRYTHKIAISNHRLTDVNDQTVSFTYKDYRDKGNKKIMTLAGDEFLRRFALHILPKQFVKIRHYGILSSRHTQLLHAQQCLLNNEPVTQKEKQEKKTWKEICHIKLNFNPDACPCCKTGRMITIELIGRNENRGPPILNGWKNDKSNT